MCQAFNWESHKHNWWSNLEGRVADIAKSGFTSVWLPPPTQSLSPEGKLVMSSPLLFLIKRIVAESLTDAFLHRLSATEPVQP